MCMRVYVYMRLGAHMDLWMFIYIGVCLNMHVGVWMYVCTDNVWIRWEVSICSGVSEHTYICEYMCMWIYVCMCMHVCMCCWHNYA